MKTLEIRDRATFIPALAVRVEPEYLMRRAGFHECTVFLIHLQTDRLESDPKRWDLSNRTMVIAHQYIIEHWDALDCGDVVDVEFILGLTKEKKVSERYG